jgi:galactonate dehydratase
MYRAHRGLRDGPFMVNTISAIDMALWDIAGKLWGVPVYRLLGGPCRDRIRGYHSDKSWKAPPGGIYEHSANPKDIERMVQMVREARQRVGPDGTVMFDAHCDMPPAVVIQFAAAIKPYDVLFIEEPAVHGNIEVFKRIRESVSVPLATGENVRTIFGIIPYLHERCIDVLQPDCGQCGGISQMHKIATLAEAYYVPLAPHCTMSFLGTTASLHCAASTPLFLIHETYPHIGEKFGGLVRKEWEMDRKTGYVTLPEGRGLGVEIDENVLAELSAKPPSEFKWLNARYKDGSIADQ